MTPSEGPLTLRVGAWSRGRCRVRGLGVGLVGGGSIARSPGSLLAHEVPVEASGSFCPWVEGLLMTSKNLNHLMFIRRKNGEFQKWSW